MTVTSPSEAEPWRPHSVRTREFRGPGAGAGPGSELCGGTHTGVAAGWRPRGGRSARCPRWSRSAGRWHRPHPEGQDRVCRPRGEARLAQAVWGGLRGGRGPRFGFIVVADGMGPGSGSPCRRWWLVVPAGGFLLASPAVGHEEGVLAGRGGARPEHCPRPSAEGRVGLTVPPALPSPLDGSDWGPPGARPANTGRGLGAVPAPLRKQPSRRHFGLAAAVPTTGPHLPQLSTGPGVRVWQTRLPGRLGGSVAVHRARPAGAVLSAAPLRVDAEAPRCSAAGLGTHA